MKPTRFVRAAPKLPQRPVFLQRQSKQHDSRRTRFSKRKKEKKKLFEHPIQFIRTRNVIRQREKRDSLPAFNVESFYFLLFTPLVRSQLHLPYLLSHFISGRRYLQSNESSTLRFDSNYYYCFFHHFAHSQITIVRVYICVHTISDINF